MNVNIEILNEKIIPFLRLSLTFNMNRYRGELRYNSQKDRSLDGVNTSVGLLRVKIILFSLTACNKTVSSQIIKFYSLY